MPGPPSATQLVKSDIEELEATMARCEQERLRIIHDRSEVIQGLRVSEYWANADHEACSDLMTEREACGVAYQENDVYVGWHAHRD